MGVLNKQPKTVAQITSGFKKLVDELDIAEAQYEEQQRKNNEEIAKREAANKDIETELAANRSMTQKLKEFIGV